MEKSLPQAGGQGVGLSKEPEQPNIVEFENTGAKGENETSAVTSAYASWTRAECVRKFWRLYITGLGVSMAGM